jgi:hypothetical protein
MAAEAERGQKLDLYLGERDLFGIGFSDNVVFRNEGDSRLFAENSLLHGDRRRTRRRKRFEAPQKQ